MVKRVDGFFDILIGKEKVFAKLEQDEAFSALLTVANHYAGVAYYDNQLIARFN